MAFAWYSPGAAALTVGGPAEPSPKTVLGTALWARWAKGFAVKPAPAPTLYEILGSDMKALWVEYNSTTRVWTKDVNSHASTSNMTAPDAGSAPVEATTTGGVESVNFNVGAAGDEDGFTGGNVGGMPGTVSGEYIWAIAINATARGAIQQVHRIIDGSSPNTLSIDAADKFTDSGATIISDSAITGGWKTIIIVGNSTNTRMWVNGTQQSATGSGSAFGGTSATWGGGSHEFGVHNAGSGFEAYPLDAEVTSLMIGHRASGSFSADDIAAIHTAYQDIINGYGSAAKWTDEEQALQLVQASAALLPAGDTTSRDYPAVTFDADASAVDYLQTATGQVFPGGTTSLMLWGCFTIENGSTDTVKIMVLLNSGASALLTIELVNSVLTVTDNGTAASITSSAITVLGDHFFVLRVSATDIAELYIDGTSVATSGATFDTSVIIAGMDSIKVGS